MKFFLTIWQERQEKVSYRNVIDIYNTRKEFCRDTLQKPGWYAYLLLDVRITRLRLVINSLSASSVRRAHIPCSFPIFQVNYFLGMLALVA